MRGFVKDQNGMATFAVTTVLILVISLILIGFSQVVSRNQRETLDRQLSTQALFVAESGINSIVSALRQRIASGEIPPSKSTCGADANYASLRLNDGTITDSDVAITCFLINTNINNLYYMGITENTPKVVPLVSANGVGIAELTLEWTPVSGGATESQLCPTSLSTYNFSTRANWNCGHGVLRSDLAAMPSGSSSQTAMSTFFRPLRVTTSVDASNAPPVAFSSRGGLVRGNCSDTGSYSKCMAKITGLTSPTYYMSLRSIYEDSSVRISGVDVNGNPVQFAGQAIIDVTARAQDVIKRIQVRVPLEPADTSDLPGYAIESSESICKRYAVMPGYYSSDSNVTCN